MKLLKLTPADTCSVVEIEEFDIDRQLDQMYRCIDCDTIDIVRIPYTNRCLIVDDNGLLRGFALNLAASLMAGRPIVGTVLLGCIRHTDEGDMITSYQGEIEPDH